MHKTHDLRSYRTTAALAAAPVVEGRIAAAVGLLVEAVGCRASIGDVFEIRLRDSTTPVEAQVVGLRSDRTLLVPFGPTEGLEIGSPIRRARTGAAAPVGEDLLGRVVDALGRPLDGHPAPNTAAVRSLHGAVRNPLRRRPVSQPLHTGVRVIDSLLTFGYGQRLGIFAGGGVGKSTLLGMMVRQADVDVCVVALVGERGREVEEFVRHVLGDTGLARSVVVAATSADAPMLRARAALYATSLAEYFRDRGKRVLLVMDSVTRYAMALREVALAAGEPATTRGYTPSVLAALPLLLERAGTCAGAGSITALYTVLVEGDDLADPIADATRAILDGHIVLTRSLAEKGRYPAVDVGASLSRCMPDLVSKTVVERGTATRAIIAGHQEAQDLIAIGAYQPGSLPRLDESLRVMPKLEAFLNQQPDELYSGDASALLGRLLAPESDVRPMKRGAQA